MLHTLKSWVSPTYRELPNPAADLPLIPTPADSTDRTSIVSAVKALTAANSAIVLRAIILTGGSGCGPRRCDSSQAGIFIAVTV